MKNERNFDFLKIFFTIVPLSYNTLTLASVLLVKAPLKLLF